jgi:four helix bundle protein
VGDLPTEVRLALTPTASAESSASASASLFPDEGLPPHEKRILGLLKSDESTHIDEIVEKLETELSSSEIFAAFFEFELAGKVRQIRGKNFVKSFRRQLSAWPRVTEAMCRTFGILRFGRRLTRCLLRPASPVRRFLENEVYGLTSQTRRASVSIEANIAEGTCRNGDVDSARFLQMAAGSASELEYHLLLARDLDLLKTSDYQQLSEVKRALASLMQRLRAES